MEGHLMATNYDKLRAKLEEMFMLDRADLDFGIYRIMNSKWDEILRFLDKDLLPQVRQVLQAAQGEIGAAGADELKQAEEQVRSLGMNPDDSPKVKDLRAKYSAAGDLNALEQEVFNHLYSFFRRYYDEGDFLSLRRYKEGVYAIPYEGEEVKLHWANADQYYIKTAEHFRDYTFKVGGDRRVHFKLVDAQTEKDNNKASEKRIFILTEENAVAEENGELLIRFEFQAAPDKRKQKEHIEEAVARILAEAHGDWKGLLQAKAPTDKNPNRTVLEKHLTDYTARNTFDYFIHKDLGGFLRRELDFYIKNEVMHLDDIEHESCPKVEQYLAKVRAIRRVAGKLIDFLAQLEEFQKSLWLKKKFVVDTQYLVTLDRVPEEFYGDIIASARQHEEWVSLYSIDDMQGDLVNPGYSKPLSVDFLKANQHLVVNTSHVPHLASRLLAKCAAIDAELTGIAIKSDNFQALSLLKTRFTRVVEGCYIDPPYNTGDDGFSYKDNYQHSSWLSLLGQVSTAAKPLLSLEGAQFTSCDENEAVRLGIILNGVYGDNNHAETLVWNKRVPKNDKGVGNIHEFIFLHTADSATRKANERSFGMLKDGLEEIYALIATLKRTGIDLVEARRKLKDFYRKQGYDRGITLYCELDPNYRVWGKINMSWPNPNTFGPRYDVINPVTGKVCPVPDRGWRWKEDTLQDAEKDGAEYELPDGSLMRGRVWYPTSESQQPSSITYLDEVESFLLRSIQSVKSDGGMTLEALGLADTVSYPKPVSLLRRLVYSFNKPEGWFMDYFAGGGTLGHALLSLNREDGGSRKHIQVDVGSCFDACLVPRLCKLTYSAEWKDGRPADRKSGVSQFVKLMSLESYEDSLANLVLRAPNSTQAELVEANRDVREDYILRYMLNTETNESASRLNVHSFEHPFEYKLKVAADTVGETKVVNVDLVETFNWLLGLRVHTMDVIRGFRVVTGRLPGPGNSENGEKALIIWRDTTENPNEKLDKFFAKQAYNTLDQEFDVIYVNGDNNLQNLRKDDQTWKVRLIEEEFHRLMWDVEDI